jgi:hypothetical protein
MSIVETVLVFAGIPLGVFALFAVVVLGPGAARAPRYRPGSPWTFKPVWYLPHPGHDALLAASHGASALESGNTRAIGGSASEPAQAAGGASGEW